LGEFEKKELTPTTLTCGASLLCELISLCDAASSRLEPLFFYPIHAKTILFHPT
jgi:hypothetical protein